MNALRSAALSVLLAGAGLAGCGSAPDAAVADAAADPRQVTQAQARQLVEAVEAAAVAKDPRAYAGLFAPDATITTVIPRRDGGNREVVRTRDEYIEAELRSHAETPDSNYSSRIDEVRLAAGGASAKVRVLAEQSMRLDGSDVSMTADQWLTIEPRDGRPVVVAVQLKMTGMTVDGQTIH